MPLPLVVWGLGAAAAGLGLGVKAACDNNKANDVNEEAESIIYAATQKLENTKKETNGALENYGQDKLDVFSTHIGTFVQLYDKIRNTELRRSKELDNLQLGNFTSVSFADIKDSYNTLSSITQGFTVGAAGGALAAYGAYAGTMSFAAAGTGAAISGLSGVAATNATLAWLGGGTLASGGAGIAGGVAVLGGLVAAPASLIFGGIFAAKASQKLSEARTNRYNAREYEDEVDIVCDKLDMIQEVVALSSMLLYRLSKRLYKANMRMKSIILDQGTDFLMYNNADQDSIFEALKYAQVIKSIIECPVLTENGGANLESQKKLRATQQEFSI